MQLKKLFFLAVVILTITTAFTHKDLNEYGRWLKFHHLQDDDFKQAGTTQTLAFDWMYAPRVLDTPSVYKSPNAAYFVDLYSILYDKDTNISINIGGWHHVQLVRTNDTYAINLFSIRSKYGYPEAAIWRNDALVEILGFKIIDKKYVPTIWKYDLEKKTYAEFLSKKTLNKQPEFYRRMP